MDTSGDPSMRFFGVSWVACQTREGLDSRVERFAPPQGGVWGESLHLTGRRWSDSPHLAASRSAGFVNGLKARSGFLPGPIQRYFILLRKSSCLQVESQVVWHANCREMPLKANGRVRLDPGLPHLVTESHLLPNIEGVLP